MGPRLECHFPVKKMESMYDLFINLKTGLRKSMKKWFIREKKC